MIVLTTGNKPADPRCLQSVKDQTLQAFHYVYTNPARSYSQNIQELCGRAKPEEVVVCLDADDYLAHPLALERIAEAHGAGAWVTYGSFKFADGRPAPWLRAMTPGELAVPRSAPFLATHTKSFRAGLVQRMRPTEFDREHGRDLALMCAAIELAGISRCAYLSDVSYVYNYENSFEHNADPAGLERERLDVAEIRSRKPLPWIEEL